MPSTLDATVGGAASNTYISQADATTYLGDRLNTSAWTNADSTEKDQALLQATRRLDVEEYDGSKNTQGQALKWPRVGAIDDDGYEFATDAIPQIVKDAQCELALWLLNQGTTDALAPTGLEGFINVKVGSLDATPRHSQKAGALPQVVLDILRPVLATSRSMVDIVLG